MATTSSLNPQLKPYADWLIRWAQSQGYRIQLTSTRRSREQQALLYQRYQRGLSSLPAAPPGTSDHEHGLAFDMVVNGDYHSPAQGVVGEMWRRMGGRWAGSADPVHFAV